MVVACGETELYPVLNNPGDNEDMDLGVPVSGFKESLLVLGGLLKTTNVLTPHHLAPHVLGNGIQESPAFSLSD